MKFLFWFSWIGSIVPFDAITVLSDTFPDNEFSADTLIRQHPSHISILYATQMKQNNEIFAVIFMTENLAVRIYLYEDTTKYKMVGISK